MPIIFFLIINFLNSSISGPYNFNNELSVIDSIIPENRAVVRNLSDSNKKKKKTRIEMEYKPKKKVRVDLDNLSDNYEEEKKAKEKYYANAEVLNNSENLIVDSSNTDVLSIDEIIQLYPRKIPAIKTKNLIHPSEIEKCKLALDTINALSGVRTISLYPTPFFEYTPEEYLKFFKEDQFIKCTGYLSRNSKNVYYLTIQFIVGSHAGKSKFGNLRKNAPLMIYSTDNESFVLMTYQGAEGKIIDNKTYYECIYFINKSDVNKLKKIEIDKIRLSFAKGYQSFEIFRVDFIKDQFKCLK